MPGPSEQQIDRFRTAARLIGDRWSLLVLYACLGGVTRFEAIQQRLGIARSVLSSRLGRLADVGLLEQRPVSRRARRLQYLPSREAEALRPVLEAMIAWNERTRSAPRRRLQSHEERRPDGFR